jgi:hypothetical protein
MIEVEKKMKKEETEEKVQHQLLCIHQQEEEAL